MKSVKTCVRADCKVWPRGETKVLHPRFLLLLQISTTLAVLLAGVSVHAQTGGLDEDTIEKIVVFGSQESYLNETVSSATKTDASAFDIPLTVNIINDSFLKDLRAETLSDAYGYTTGLSESGINANSFTLRGLPANLQSVQVDGLPGLASRFGSPTTANIERVEILKGPASVLYGQLEPGGLINIISKRPSQTASVSLDVSLQSYATGVSGFIDDNGVTATLDATGALTADERLLYRFVASGEAIDSFRDDVQFRNYYFYPSITYLATDTASLTLGLEYLNEEGRADHGLVAINNDIDLTAPVNVRYQEPQDEDNDEGIVLFATLDWSIRPSLRLTANWRGVWHEDNRILFENNRVNDAPDPANATLRRRDRNQLNKRRYHFLDLNLRNEFDTGALRHEVLLGFNGGFERRDFERIRFGVNVAPHISVLNPVWGEGVPSSIRSGTDRITDLWNYGVYFLDVVHLGEHWVLTAGGRYEEQDVDFTEQRSGRKADQRTDAFVPMIGLVFKPSDSWSVYASYGESFDPNSVERTDVDNDPFEPEEGEQYEIGAKASFFDDRATWTFAYFDIEKTNIVERNLEGDYELLGALESRGIETELLALPIHNWQAKLGYAYVDAVVAHSPSETTRGNPMAFAPEHDLYLWTRYNFDRLVLGGQLGVSLGINYESERFTHASLGDRVELPDYLRVDIGAYYETEHISVAFNFENLFDEKYFIGGSRDTRLYPGDPRKFTLSFTMNF